MLVAVATVVHRVFTFDKSLSTTIVVGTVIVGTMTAFSAWHCITDEITMHSVLFGKGQALHATTTTRKNVPY